MRFRWVILASIAALGCGTPDMDAYVRTHATAAEHEFAKRYLALLAAHRTDSALALLAPSIPAGNVRTVMPAIESVLVITKLDSLHYIGFNETTMLGTDGATRTVNFTFEAPTTTGEWMYGNVALTHAGTELRVAAFSAYPIPRSLEAINAFSMDRASWLHLLFLGLAILMPVATLCVAAYVVRSRMPRRWLWAVAALVASPVFALNWTTGRAGMTNTLFHLFGSGFLRPGAAAPVMLSVGVPVGAIVAWFKVKAWREAMASQPAPFGSAPQGGAATPPDANG